MGITARLVHAVHVVHATRNCYAYGCFQIPSQNHVHVDNLDRRRANVTSRI
jgi:hypothetical protein